MAEVQPSLLLLSSNIRRRYAEDILTALALPEGAVIQFRYDAEYVAPTLQQKVANKEIIDCQALLYFIADESSPSPFLMPVRVATVTHAENVADMFVLRLRALGYPDLSDSPLELTEICQESKKFHDKLVQANGRYYPAITKFPNPHLNTGADRAQMWTSIVRRLAHHPTFHNAYFVRVDPPLASSHRAVSFDGQGYLHLRDGQSIKLPISFYSEKYSESSRTSLSCSTDGTFLRVSSDDTYDVALRYDSVEFWLQPRTEAFDALSRVTIRLAYGLPAETSEATPLTTNAHFPVVVKRSRSRLALRITASAVGAFLVALPAILGQHSSLQLRIVAAVVGALLLAFAAIVVARGNG
jgi:hypothetical protein